MVTDDNTHLIIANKMNSLCVLKNVWKERFDSTSIPTNLLRHDN